VGRRGAQMEEERRGEERRRERKDSPTFDGL
jgi:hypothetical protein